MDQFGGQSRPRASMIRMIIASSASDGGVKIPSYLFVNSATIGDRTPYESYRFTVERTGTVSRFGYSESHETD